MSKDNPKNPSWKHGAGAGPSRPASNTSRKPWQPSQQPSANRTANPRTRFRKRAGMAGLFGALLIAAMALVFNFVSCHKPPAMLVIAPESSTSLSSPANVYGANSVQALADWAKGGKNRPRVATEDWKTALDKTSEKTIVLYFAAHGAADREGPYLWMPAGEKDGIDLAHKLKVTDILTRLADSKLKDRHKLVIFDATQVSASWAHGYLHNDFSRALKALDGEIEKIPNLVVLCSTDEDQRSWVSEELRRTIFGHFLEAGLRNGAGESSKRVNAWVLYEYLSKEVPNWTRANRDADQTPILLPTRNRESLATKIELVSNPDTSDEVSRIPPGTFAVPESLKTAWEQRAKLEERKPAPETIAPDLWRAYLDTLLRWEFLVRAGADTVAIESRARTLGDQLRGNPLFESEPACVANSLPAARALGATGIPTDSIAFDAVWIPPKDKRRDQVWQAIREQYPTQVPALRLAAANWMLDKLRQPETPPTKENLERAELFLTAVEESNPRPTETHYLRMLQRHLPDKSQTALLVRALDLRREAERVSLLSGAKDGDYPYADQVHRWLQASLVRPDEDRRHAEDRLFVGDDESIKLAVSKMNDARKAYDACGIQARSIADALRLRDRVYSRLPYYARWLAGYRGNTPPDGVETLLKQVEQIAAGMHELHALLEVVPPDPRERIAEIASKSDLLSKSFDGLEKSYATEVENLSGTVYAANWHAIDSALSVPFLKADQRVKLLYMLRTISSSLLTGTQTQAGGARAPAVDAQTAAQRQGRMALAMLGERWIDEAPREGIAPTGALPYSPRDLRDRVLHPKQGVWWESLREAGEQIGWLWRLMPASINANLDKAVHEEIRDVAPYLARAGHLSRLLDCATPLSVGRRPIEDERRYWMHELLLWQAKRTTDDGWAALDPRPTVTPYCVEAGKRYAQAAENLILGLGGNRTLEPREKARRLARVTERVAQIKAPRIVAECQPSLSLTDVEKDWEVVYLIKPEQPVGYPMLRYVAPTGPIKYQNTAVEKRMAITAFASGGTDSIKQHETYAFKGAPAENAEGTLEVDLFYRGQSHEMKTHVRLAGKATIEWEYIPPTGSGRFAVVADPKLKRGAIALVVDVTLSMHDLIDATDAQGRRIKSKKIIEAVAALKELIGRLKPGIVLNIGVFYGDEKGEPQLDWLLAKPTPFDGQENERNQLIAIANKIEPSKYGKTTPLARTIVDKVIHKDELEKTFPKNFSGFRSVVVLTDGEDNISGGESGKIVRRALLDCQKDVGLNIIFFGLNDTEAETASKQFLPIEDEEEFVQNYRTPGKVWPGVKNRRDLVNSLEESMMPKIRYLPVSKNIERLQSLRVTLLNDISNRKETPPLLAGSYDLRATLTDSRRYLKLERGDRMLLQLVDTPNGLDLQLPPFGDLLTAQVPPIDLQRAYAPQKQACLTLAYNSLTSYAGDYDLEMYAAVEKLIEGRNGDLRMARPNFVWFEVEAQGAAKKPVHLRIENMADRIAPAWKVSSGPWPAVDGEKILVKPAAPRVFAWWVDRLPKEDHRISFTELGRVSVEMNAQPLTFDVQGQKVTIESIDIENQFLRINLKDLNGVKVVARLEGLEANAQRAAPGERHQFFMGTNQYRAKIGPLEADDLKLPVTLRFYALEKLKGVGSGSGHTYSMELPARPPALPGQGKDDILIKMGLN